MFATLKRLVAAVASLLLSILCLPFGRDPVDGVSKAKLYLGYLLGVIGRLKHTTSKVEARRFEQRQIQATPTLDHNDSWYFQAAALDSNGKQTDVVIRLGFREKKKYVETWFYMRHPDFGDDVLTHPQTRYPLEDVSVQQTKKFRGGPLTFECVEEYKKWKIVFDGELIRHKPFVDHKEAIENTEQASRHSKSPVVLQRFEAHAELEYIMDTDPFNFDTQLDDWATARALAREPWSLGFFLELTKRHQTHYEQNGHLSGTLKLQSSSDPSTQVQEIQLHGLRGMRDHSFGSREWGYILRWVTLFGCLANGSSFNLICVRMPTLTRIVVGYYRDSNRGITTPIVDARPELHQLGEKNSAVPPQFPFEFKLQDGRWISGKCDTEHLHLFALGDESSDGTIKRSLLYEGLTRFEVDGVSGVGISEFTYAIQ